MREKRGEKYYIGTYIRYGTNKRTKVYIYTLGVVNETVRCENVGEEERGRQGGTGKPSGCEFEWKLICT